MKINEIEIEFEKNPEEYLKFLFSS